MARFRLICGVLPFVTVALVNSSAVADLVSVHHQVSANARGRDRLALQEFRMTGRS